MATFNFTGAISGLDTAGLITAMLSTETQQLSRLTAQRTVFTTKQKSWDDLRSLLKTFQATSEAFTKLSAGASRSAASSVASVLTATAAAGTIPGAYQVSVGHLATSTRATSTASMGTAVTMADTGSTLSSLALPGTIKAGQVSMVVDGKVVHATIGDPTTTTLGDALTALGDALTSQVQANEGTTDATVTAAVVNNRIELSISGSSTSHAVSFGVGGDTSNLLGITGLSGSAAATLASGTPITGRTNLGVTRTSTALDAAGLTGLTSGAGTLKINGASIAYDTTTDSLATLVTRINASTAGVTATLDRTNDKLVLTAKAGGSSPMGIEDTGTLAAALGLAPGTTDAQTLGSQSSVTVDGQTYLSDTNKVTTAIPGVTLTLLAEGTSTVSVTPDAEKMTSAVKALVDAYNALADKLDTYTANVPGAATKGALTSESDVSRMAVDFRRMLTSTAAASGVFTSLAAIGVTTGAVGAAKGTTDRLVFDDTKLKAALEQDPTAVSDLLSGAQGVMAPIVERLKTWTKVGGRIDDAQEAIRTGLKGLTDRENRINDLIDAKRVALEAKFARLEASLAQLQSTQNSLSSTVSSMNSNSGG